MNLKVLMLMLSVVLTTLIFSSECISEKVLIVGELVDSEGNKLPGGKIKAIQEGTIIEQSATKKGAFEISLYPGTATLIYHVPGYKELEDTIPIEPGNEKIVKTLQRESVGGWWTLLLLVPGVCGLIVAWCKEFFGKNRSAGQVIQDRLLVALFNGVVWAGVLACIWYGAAGVTKVQFFHNAFTFEFFVPLLGYFGSLLYVFDLFRGKDSDKFKEKEFGMRIVMGPYVAIIMVALFGKDLSFIDLESYTGQGTLAFLSGLIVVVAFQGLIERANEMLGKWRREKSPYVASPLAEKFNLSEDEDKELRKITLRHPEQLPMWPDEKLGQKVAEVAFDEHYILAMKRSIESEQLKKHIGDLIWERLRPINVTTIQDFSRLRDEEIQNIAKESPELSDERLIELKDKTKEFVEKLGVT